MPLPIIHPNYPTPIHKQAIQTTTTHFSQQPEVEAILLIGSGARGKSVGDESSRSHVIRQVVEA